MRRTQLFLLTSVLVGVAFPRAAQCQDDREAAVAGAQVIAEQAAAWNRNDLDGSMAILPEDADWRTIGRESLTGKTEIRNAHQGWMDGSTAAGGFRMIYPAEGITIQTLGNDVAVADVQLIWELPPPTPGAERPTSEETLFYVFRRNGDVWRLTHVRNTTNADAN